MPRMSKQMKEEMDFFLDEHGRIKDYYENEESIDLREGGVLECTGEYQLQWIGEQAD